MVSLENTKNPKGGFSFENFTPTNDDFIETVSNSNLIQNENLPLSVEFEPNFKRINTTLAIITQILISILLIASTFISPILCGEGNKNCAQFGPYEIALFVHGGIWILMFGYDRFYHFHHMKSRRDGYLEFYRVTRVIRSLPLIIASAANSLLVVAIKIIEKYCPNKCTSANLEPIHFLQMFVGVECLLLISILIYYLVLTVKFNQSKKTPDISKEIDRPIFLPSQLKDIGYKDSNYINNILENQADMIRYLQERNEKLSQKLYQLTDKTNSSNANIN